MKKNFLTIIITTFLCLNAFGQQQVISGLKINKPVTWSGTIIIDGDVTVENKGRLTVEAGTKVLFKPQTDKTSSGKDKTRSELIIKGSLIVKGHMERKVTFSSMSKEPRMGDWYGIYIGNPKQISIIDYAIIEYAYNGVLIKKSNPVIRNSQVRLNYNAGILCEVKSEAKITKNIISENGYAGVICGLGAKPVLSHNLISLNEIGVVALSLSQPNLGNLKKGNSYNQGENNIFENTEYDLYNHTKLPLQAENNSWGNNNDLDSRIYDAADDAQYGVVDMQPVFRQNNLDDLILVAQENSDTRLAENTTPNNVEAQKRRPENPTGAGSASQNKNNTTATKISQTPSLASQTSQTPAIADVSLNDNNENNSPTAAGKKEAEEINPPALTQTETERPLATLEEKPVKPQINYDQIFFEHFLDSGTKRTLKKVAPKVTQFGPKGRVIVRAVVGKDGRVEEAKVVKGLSDHYDHISLNAAEQFIFSTGKVKGVPVKFYTNILFEF